MGDKINLLKQYVAEHALVTCDKHKIVSPSGKSSEWLFDMRNIFLKPESLDIIADIFWEKYQQKYPFQIGGQEIAAIPLIAAIILKSQRMGKPVNGIIIRKSRKPSGLQKIIEGDITDEKIILVDDLINTGSTILRQLKALGDVNRKVSDVFTIVNFRGEYNSEKLAKEGILLHSLFSLEDFGLNLGSEKTKVVEENFKEVWRFKLPDPNYLNRFPKSAPCIDDKKIYFGSDTGHFYALNQDDGSLAWKFQVGYPVNGKSISSSPAIHENTVYFGSYDGNVYALDKETGNIRWRYMDADFVGSSPALAPDLGLLFIGMEFGLFKKQGGIVALDMKTGKMIWSYKMEKFVHCSPVYCPEKKLVAIGGNDSYAYLFDARKGKLQWKFKTGGPIKASLIFDASKNLLIFGSFDKNLYALDISSGEVKGKFETRDVIISTPKIYKDNIYLSSTDKNIYSINLESGKMNWRFTAEGRFLSDPEIVSEKVLAGATDGKLYEIDCARGKLTAYFQTTERIINKIAYNPNTQKYFIPTYANEIYCLERRNA